MIELVIELRSLLDKKRVSPETAARLMDGISSRQVRRWLDGESVPNFRSREAIRKGIRRIRRLL